ncbi:hypothetical protein EVAR_78905_1 [Eumeta japonica]|uniref:Uncharacterized protein n=1 Tax=Eumeta variegata TaxID=151549 RepID=A0A4C1U2P7_EUMVA|nr:hypothetical protein EVAR_78905_1 [Eumeta japonica]
MEYLKEEDRVDESRRGGVGHRSFHSLAEIQQQKVLLHVRIFYNRPIFVMQPRWPQYCSSTKRRAFFFNRSSRETVFSHRSHTVCDFNQATTRPRRVIAVWNARTTSDQGPGVTVKKIGVFADGRSVARSQDIGFISSKSAQGKLVDFVLIRGREKYVESHLSGAFLSAQ